MDSSLQRHEKADRDKAKLRFETIRKGLRAAGFSLKCLPVPLLVYDPPNDYPFFEPGPADWWPDSSVSRYLPDLLTAAGAVPVPCNLNRAACEAWLAKHDLANTSTHRKLYIGKVVQASLASVALPFP